MLKIRVILALAALTLSATSKAEETPFQRIGALFNSAQVADPTVLQGYTTLNGNCVNQEDPNRIIQNSLCIDPFVDDPVLGNGMHITLKYYGYGCSRADQDSKTLTKQANGDIGYIEKGASRMEHWLRYHVEKSTWVYMTRFQLNGSHTLLCYFK